MIPIKPLCQYYESLTAKESTANPEIPDDTVFGCRNEQGPGPLYFFVPVYGGAVRVGVCNKHAKLLAQYHGA